MKRKEYTDIICKKFCRYYKPGKEELTCGSYEFIQNNITIDELRKLVEDRIPFIIPDKDLVCGRCSFRIDGCDFYEETSRIPCRGYIILFKKT